MLLFKPSPYLYIFFLHLFLFAARIRAGILQVKVDLCKKLQGRYFYNDICTDSLFAFFKLVNQQKIEKIKNALSERNVSLRRLPSQASVRVHYLRLVRIGFSPV